MANTAKTNEAQEGLGKENFTNDSGRTAGPGIGGLSNGQLDYSSMTPEASASHDKEVEANVKAAQEGIAERNERLNGDHSKKH